VAIYQAKARFGPVFSRNTFPVLSLKNLGFWGKSQILAKQHHKQTTYF
jgi:hypothetical protein